MERDIIKEQEVICKQFNVSCYYTEHHMMIGVADNLTLGLMPINGLRHKPEKGTSGWYIWAGGEILQNDPNFFKPYHVEHLQEMFPDILKYLGLPPGWRFQVDNDEHEDVWEDTSLLHNEA